MRKIAVLGLVLLVVSLTIVACGGAPAATQPGAAPAAGQAAAKTGGVPGRVTDDPSLSA